MTQIFQNPHYRVCNLCEAMCGIEVTVDHSSASDTKKIIVKPDKKDPFSKGSMCPKAPALASVFEDENRLKYPVKKTGSGWEEISWAEAYDIVETNLKSIREKYGADTIASYLGNPIVHNLGMLLFAKKLTEVIGSQNTYSATTMDQLPHHFAAHFMFGHEFRIPVPDIDRTNHMIVMGANPLASNGSIMTSAGVTERLRAIQARGGKFIVIDPRKTETAKIASEHHFIRPGMDLFFLAAFMHILLRDEHIQLGRLAPFIAGFENLRGFFDAFTPEIAAARTGIAAAEIETLVSEFVAQDSAVLYGRMGLSTQPHGGLCNWLINTINIVTGNFDRPGGMMFPTPAIELARGKVQPDAVGRWKSRARGLSEFYGEYPVSGMVDEFMTEGEGKIRAFVTICGNPVLSTPSGGLLDKALEDIDFMVSMDNYINETTRHADIILPTPSGLEIEHYDLIFHTISVSNNAKYSEAMMPVADDRPFDWQILKELIGRLSPNGLDLFTRFATPRRIVNWGLMLGAYGKLSHPKRFFSGLSLRKVLKSKHGLRLGPMQPRVPEGLLTPHRKIEIAPSNFVQRLSEVREDVKNESANADRQDNEFILIGKRNVNTNNSWMHQFDKLSRSKLVRCTAMINPQDAERLSIAHGGDVLAKTRVGEIQLPAEVTDTVMPGVVCIPHGFGHTRKGTRIPVAEAKAGASVNDITDHHKIDPLTGNAAFSGQYVTLTPLSAPAEKTTITGKPITIIYGSRTGNAEFLACEAARQSEMEGMVADVFAMDEIDMAVIAGIERLLVVCSTYGEGDMPDNAQALWDEANGAEVPDLSRVHYSVLALGDTSYETFCKAGHDWDQRLGALGARQVIGRADCDVDYTDVSSSWMDEALPAISKVGDQTALITRERMAGGHQTPRIGRDNPLTFTLTEKKRLTAEGSSKETVHYGLKLEDTGQQYKVGDILNILPMNSKTLVDEVLSALNISGEKVPPGQAQSLRELLTSEYEIRTPSTQFVGYVAANAMGADIRSALSSDDQNARESVLYGRDIVDLLELLPAEKTSCDEILPLLRPLTPRSYSIASSPKAHGDEVNLCVASVRYDNQGRQHNGVGSTYLHDVAEVGDGVKGYFVSNGAFTLPEEVMAPLIMVGPGTGIAPFRGFLAELDARVEKTDAWLFFGDRNAATDYLYEEELTKHLRDGVLKKLDVAFSRDQAEKIYVQHRMHEHGAELYAWLERGAHIFVCGDAERMAKDVDQALCEIVAEHGKLSKSDAQAYLDTLKRQKRYLRDVY